MPVTSVNPGQIIPPSGLPTNPCGIDFLKLDELDGKGKFNSKLFFKSLLAFALEEMLPGPIAQMINNQTIVPQELPGVGAILGVAQMLLDTAGAPANLQGLWGMVSGNSTDSYGEIAGAFAPNLEMFATSIANMPAAAINGDSIASIAAAYASIARDGASPLDARIQAGLMAACVPFQAGSQVIFQAYDSSQLLKATTNRLQVPLNASARVHTAAKTAVSTVENIARFGVSQQFTASGLANQRLSLDQIHGAANLSGKSLNMCGGDALKTLSVLRQTCDAVDAFYGTNGFGTIDWGASTRDLATEILSGSIEAIAIEAAGFGAFTAGEIMTGINSTVDAHLSRALCGGGSDNLADSAKADFGNAVGIGLTAVGTIATLYASASEMTQGFQNTLNVMQSFGSSSAINQMVGGNFSGLFGLASGQISNPKLALLRAWRDCIAQQSGVDPATLQILDDKIKEEESKANVGWAKSIGIFDANGYFDLTKVLRKAQQKVQTAILGNKPLATGTTT